MNDNYLLPLTRSAAQELMALIDTRLAGLARSAGGLDAAPPAVRGEVAALKQAGARLLIFHDGVQEAAVRLAPVQAEALLWLRRDPLLDISPELCQALDGLAAQLPAIYAPAPDIETQLKDEMRCLAALMASSGSARRSARRMVNDRYQALLREWLEAHGLRANAVSAIAHQGWSDAAGRPVPSDWIRRLINELTGPFTPDALRREILDADPLAFTPVPKTARRAELKT